MDSWNLRNFRNDLSIFIDIIEKAKITGDFSILSDILKDIENKTLIEYQFENICFFIQGRITGTLPVDVNYYQIFFDNMLMVKNTLDPTLDPLHGYSLDINIHAYKSKKSTTKVYASSWHHDRHMERDLTKYTHPSYHFQFGGKKMELLDDELSVLSCPRIPHPPMDIFLGFHFIIANFFNGKQFDFVDKLFNDYDYQQIIKRSQERLWKPYFRAFDSSNTHNDFVIKNVFPLYLH